MAVYAGQGNLVLLAAVLGKSFYVGVVAAFYLNCQSYRAESKSWRCLGLLMITLEYALKSATHSGLVQDVFCSSCVKSLLLSSVTVGVSTPPTSWSVLSSLPTYTISFTIQGMSFLVNHWRWQHFQCGKWVADWVIAVLSHGCSRGGWSKHLSKRLLIVPEAGLVTTQYERKSIGWGKSSYWLPALPGPHSVLSWSRCLLKRLQVFIGSSSIW